jgi:peptidyl-prolyl cis-trans isomerase D
MLKHFQDRNSRFVKITMGVVLGLISLAMVITLVPGALGSFASKPDTVATVGGEDITMSDAQQYFAKQTRGQNFPPEVQRFYMGQVVNQMILERAMVLEAQRLGLRVTPEEQADRIKQLLPAVFVGDTWVGKDRYSAEVQQRTGMSVAEFEDWVRTSLVEEKFRQLVTDGITVTPAEILSEFRRKNEKVKLDYVLLKPADLESGINPTDDELSAFFKKDSARYQVPERRSAHYALLSQDQIRQRAEVTEADVQAYYNQHLDTYRIPERAHVEHILFKTVGKTDAENAEIRKKAEEVLNQIKHGGNFEDLAKKNSDDTTKDKGGDLGWIVRGQTVPEFEKAAFTMPVGSVSDLVKTQYGYHIIKVIAREQAHTQPLDDVRLTILSALNDQKGVEVTDEVYNKIASALRKSNKQKLDDIAKQFGMITGDTPPADATQPLGTFGNAPELHEALLHLRPGDLSAPLRVEQGILILSLKDVDPAHPATLAEVRDKVLKDYRTAKALDLARTKAQELASRVRAGASLSDAAKALGLEVKSTDLFAIDDSVNGIGTGKTVEGAFNLQTGQLGAPTTIAGGEWLVYKVTDHQQPNPQDLEKQRADIEKNLLESKRAMAFEAFRNALQDRLKQEGKITINQEVLNKMTHAS